MVQKTVFSKFEAQRIHLLALKEAQEAQILTSPENIQKLRQFSPSEELFQAALKERMTRAADLAQEAFITYAQYQYESDRQSCHDLYQYAETIESARRYAQSARYWKSILSRWRKR